MSKLYGAIEAGGTKLVCAVGRGPKDLRAEERFPTTDPESTIGRAVAFFRRQRQRHGQLKALGIASFGPVDLDPASPKWGHITSTPKPGWADTDLAGALGRALELEPDAARPDAARPDAARPDAARPGAARVAFDTDVNGAALGEGWWGAARGLDTFVYVTVGTGIGGGGLAGGRLLHGLVHPEMGHMRIPHELEADPYPGRCPFHRDCLEGLASGPAIAERWGQPAEELPPDHPAWELEAEYLALMAVNLTTVLSPRRILLGGGVMSQPRLFPLVRRRLRELLAGYLRSPQIDDIDRYVVPPALGERAGVLGALALARRLAGDPPR